MTQHLEPTTAKLTKPRSVVKSGLVARVPLWHLLISVAIACCTALLVFQLWFPPPYRQLAGGLQLFWLVVGVDVVCGPLLTWLLFRPGKTRLALSVDLVLVVTIQLTALAYGLHTLSYARPLTLVFEVDRFRVITFADIPEDELKDAPHWVKPWGLHQERLVGIRASRNSREKLASVDASLQGVEPSQRPSWWQDYALSVPQALERAKPLSVLRQKHPGRMAVLDQSIADAVSNSRGPETKNPEALRWLPLISRQSLSWVALIDPATGRVTGYAPLDGFF